METRGHGDTGTRGHGDTFKEEDRGTNEKTRCKLSPCPLVSPSPHVPHLPHLSSPQSPEAQIVPLFPCTLFADRVWDWVK